MLLEQNKNFTNFQSINKQNLIVFDTRNNLVENYLPLKINEFLIFKSFFSSFHVF